MVSCRHCGQEMNAAPGCTVAVEEGFADGIARTRIPYGYEFKPPYHYPRPCHDCGAHFGHFHHPGCDMDDCARCGGQLLSCGCLEDAEPVEPWAKRPWPWFCHDCGADCSALDENYMVRDEVWPIGPHDGMLCVGCLEARIERRLVREDFQPRWLTQVAPHRPLSVRLGERIG